jgi:hypothetical protein
VSPLCSRNARSQKTLVGRAQWGTHPGHPGDNEHEQAWKYHTCSLAAALLDGLFEHPAGMFSYCDAGAVNKDSRVPIYFSRSVVERPGLKTSDRFDALHPLCRCALVGASLESAHTYG